MKKLEKANRDNMLLMQIIQKSETIAPAKFKNEAMTPTVISNKAINNASTKKQALVTDKNIIVSNPPKKKLMSSANNAGRRPSEKSP